MPDITIPDDAVEATAALIYETRTYRLWVDAPDDIKASWRGDALEILAAAAPLIAAQALRDAAKQIECQHVGSCLIVGNDYCNAPEDGSMVRSAMIARANRIEADHG